MRLLLLYRLWLCESGRKVKLAAFFVARFAGEQKRSWGRPVTLLRGSESRHQIAKFKNELGLNRPGSECDREAVNRKEYSSE